MRGEASVVFSPTCGAAWVLPRNEHSHGNGRCNGHPGGKGTARYASPRRLLLLACVMKDIVSTCSDIFPSKGQPLLLDLSSFPLPSPPPPLFLSEYQMHKQSLPFDLQNPTAAHTNSGRVPTRYHALARMSPTLRRQ